MMKFLSTFLIISFFFAGIAAPVVSAQISSDVTLKIYPQLPKVGDQVTATVESSDVNLDFQNISWNINGETVLSGVGQTSVIFTIKPDTSVYVVRAVMGDISGQLVREKIIRPGTVILLWEAVDSYTPLWYRGKSLMPAEGTVRITAIPVGSETLEKLFFVWKQGTNSLGALSGYAKNSIVLRNSVLLDSMDVSVVVSSADGSYQATGEISIPRSEPDVRLWAPRTGQTPLYEQGGTLKLFGNNVTVQAIPYTVTARPNMRGLTFEWLINSIPYIHAEGEPDNSIYLSRQPSMLDIDLSIASIGKLLQKHSVQKTVVFD